VRGRSAVEGITWCKIDDFYLKFFRCDTQKPCSKYSLMWSIFKRNAPQVLTLNRHSSKYPTNICCTILHRCNLWLRGLGGVCNKQYTSNTIIYLLTLEYRTFWVSHWATIYVFKSPSNWAFCLAHDPSLLITCLDISAPNWVPKFTCSNFVHDNVLSACNRWL